MRRSPQFIPVLFCTAAVIAAALSGCAPSPAPSDQVDHAGAFEVLRGKARIVSIDPVIGRAILDVGGRHVTAYWDTARVIPRRGDYVLNGPLKAPTVNPAEPIVKEQEMTAKPGDLIGYVGIKTGPDELLLRGISILGH
jgi:hypothetical protein